MTAKTEGVHVLEFLLSEASGYRSREQGTVTVAGAVALPSGQLLGQIRGAATAAAVAGNVGNGTMGAVTLGAGAKVGVYRLAIVEPATNGGEFVVEDPDGVEIGNGTVAVAFSAGGVAFTLADGSTDFSSGDMFTITVAAGTGKYVAYSDAATNGAEVATAILIDPCPAVNGDYKCGIIKRDAEVFTTYLTGSDANGLADLALRGIIARS